MGTKNDSNSDTEKDLESTETLETEAQDTLAVDEDAIEVADLAKEVFDVESFLSEYDGDAKEALSYFRTELTSELSEIKNSTFITQAQFDRAKEIKEYSTSIDAILERFALLDSIEIPDIEIPDVKVSDVETTDVLDSVEELSTEQTEEIEAEETTAVLSDKESLSEELDSSSLNVESEKDLSEDTELSIKEQDEPVHEDTDSLSNETKEPATQELTSMAKPNVPEIFSPELSDTTNTADVTSVIKVGAGASSNGNHDGVFSDFKEVAKSTFNLYDKLSNRGSWNLRGDVSDDKVVVASIEPTNASTFEAITQTHTAQAVTEIFDKALVTHNEEFNSWQTMAAKQNSLVASGGLCAPFAPTYDFFRVSVPQNPVDRSLPTVRAPRGGIKFIKPTDFRKANGAFAVISCADDAAGYESTPEECGGPGPTPDKPCICVDCPKVVECCVSAISQCVRWGNFNYYTFPEQVESFMQDLAVNYSIVKEQFYLDTIDAESIATTSGASYGASKDILWDLTVAAVGYRYRNHMPLNATLDVYLPAWSLDLIKIDLANNVYSGAEYMNITDAAILAAFRSRNLRVTFYYDAATGVLSPNQVQDPGALLDLPRQLVSYIFSPGTFVKLSGFNLDFGIVRDSVLNGSNDLQMFMEEFTGICKVGIESIKITHDICANGTGGGEAGPFCSQNG